MDDVVETYIMNLFFYGEISTMPAKISMFNGELYIIRPLVYIKEKTITSNAPTLIHEEGDVIYRTIRDFFSNDIKEVYVDGEKGFTKAKKYAEIIAKDQVKKIKRYKGKVPLFHSKEIEKYLKH